jgi:hypothetical protein
MPSRQLPTMGCVTRAFRSATRFACVALSVVAIAASTATTAAAQDPPATATASPPPLTGPRPQQDTFGPQDEAPGSRSVTVSFAENFIPDRLPFDVPFNVTGAVDTAVRRLELTVYRVPASVELAALITYLQKTVDCVGQQPPGLRVSQSTTNTAADGRFSLFVNALDPQYYYAFCFVGVTPVSSAEIDADVRRVLAAAVPTLDTEGDISVALLRDVRGVMRNRIAQLGAGRPVFATIPDGNLFDARPNDPRFAALIGPLLNPYLAMSAQSRNFTQALNELQTDLATARASTPITTELLDALPSATTRLPTIGSAITGTSQFDATAYSFDSAKALLDAALNGAAGNAAQLAALNPLVSDLTALVDAAQAYGIEYDRLRAAAATLIGFVALESRAVTVTLGSSVLGADLARSAYVSLDAGIAYPWRLETMVFYAGTNIYFRPINKAAPLRYKGTFLHRFALTVGITTTVKDESRRAEDLRTTDDEETSNSLLLGAGFRVTPSLRVGGGVLVFKESDPNPLIDQTSVTMTPYVSFAADVDVAQLFRSLF